jgi:hypothetical protein
MTKLKVGTILFHGTRRRFGRLRGPAFLSKDPWTAWFEGASDHPKAVRGKGRLMVFVVKRDVVLGDMGSSGSRTYRDLVSEVRRTRQEGYSSDREILLRSPSKALKFMGEVDCSQAEELLKGGHR